MSFLQIVDTTLRDGEQSPGVVFSDEEKHHIAKMCDKIGVDEVEIGVPSMSAREPFLIREILSENYNFKSISWCRAVESDIDSAHLARTDVVHISFPVSSIQLKAIGKSEQWVLDLLPKMVKYAFGKFDTVYIGAQDASRADFDFLCTFIELATNCGVQRVRIADTVGLCNPLGVAIIFEKLKKKFNEIEFEFHGHNDLGMAVANTITAIQNGCDAVSVTVGGIGERAGNAPLEEIIMASEYSLHYPNKYNKKYITELCSYVYNSIGRDIPFNKPIIGSMITAHESGIHTRSILKDRESYQIFDAEEFGGKNGGIIFGKHSGKASVQSLLSEYGVDCSEKMINSVLKEIKTISQQKKSVVSEREILEIVSVM